MLRRYALLLLLGPSLALACSDDGAQETSGSTEGDTETSDTTPSTSLTTVTVTETSPTGDSDTATTDDTTTGDPTTDTATTDDPTTGTPTTGDPTDTDGTTTGATDGTGGTGDTGTTGAPDDCPDIDPTTGFIFYNAGNSISIYRSFDVDIGDPALSDRLQVEFYTNDTGTFDLTSADVNDNYATCEQCVRAFQDIDPDAGTLTGFYQSEGSIEVAAGTPPNDGDADITFTGVRLVEVTIDENFVSTPVPDGLCLDIIDGTFSMTPPEWTCALSFLGDQLGCDCGCGAADPDCGEDPTIDSCDFCDAAGSCNTEECPGTIDPNDISTCQ